MNHVIEHLVSLALGVIGTILWQRKGSLVAKNGWTFASGARVQMRLAPGTMPSQLSSLGFSGVTFYPKASDVPSGWPMLTAGLVGPWAEAISDGGFVPKGVVLEAHVDSLFPIPLPDPAPSRALAPVIGALAAQPPVVLTSSTPWAYYTTLVAIAQRHGWDPLGMMQIQWSESNINPAAQNPGGAVGLIQFDGSLPGVGYTGTAAQFAQLSAVQQLPYVETYYAQKPMPVGANGTAFYLANYEPAKLSHWENPSYVLDTVDDGTGFYKANASAFDVAHKGYITVGDLTARLERVCTGATWSEHLARLQWAIGAAGGTGASVATAAVAAMAVLLAGVAAWSYVQWTPAWSRRLQLWPGRAFRAVTLG